MIAEQKWVENGKGVVFVANQDDNCKTKNIVEKITFDSEFLFIIVSV